MGISSLEMFMDIWEKNEELRTEDLPGYSLGIRRVLWADGVEEGKAVTRKSNQSPITKYWIDHW